MRSSQESSVLYRKGKLRGHGSAWFDNLDEAINYDCSGERDIYYLIIYPEEYGAFKQNGVGIVLKEDCRGMWDCLELRVRKVPPSLIGMLQQGG